MDVTAETAGLTRWISHTAAPKSIPGHHLTYDRNNYGWCSCGKFCGSGGSDLTSRLDHTRRWLIPLDSTQERIIQRRDIRDRFELHLARLHQRIEW